MSESLFALSLVYPEDTMDQKNARLALGQTFYDLGDFSKALFHWKSAQKLGSAQALCNLGILYEQGHVIGGANLRLATKYYKKAHAQKIAEATHRLGVIRFFYKGKEEGLYLLKEAASQDLPEALFDYAKAIFHNSKNIKRSVYFLSRSLSVSIPRDGAQAQVAYEAFFYLGLFFATQKQNELALDYVLYAAEARVTKAETLAGFLFLKMKQEVRAEIYFKRAYAQGDIVAARQLALLMTTKTESFLDLLLFAAEEDDPIACYELAIFLCRGRDSHEKTREVFSLLKRSSDSFLPATQLLVKGPLSGHSFTQNELLKTKRQHKKHWIGPDYGQKTADVFLLWGF